jgi:hypothetical protein
VKSLIAARVSITAAIAALVKSVGFNLCESNP